MDDLRFRSQLSPRNDSTMNPLASPSRNGSRLPPPVSTHDPRSNLPRRFTTDSGRVPTLTSMTSPLRGPEPASDYQTMHKVQLIEKKKLEYERIREQRRRFELEMQKLDQKQRQEALELAQMEEEMTRFGGHQSEPTTPPEYRDSSGFPSMFSRPNRYSTSSLTSPPGLFNRPGRSGSQLTSPPNGMMHRFGFDDPAPMQQQLPSRSVPTTRRNSDDEDKEEAVRQDPTSHRATNALNRYSMPVTRSRNGFYELNLDQTGTARFLFGDDEPHAMPRRDTPDESFPTLVRREDQMLSASSAALDLALSATPNPEQPISNGWGSINRHRSQQSMSSINGPTSSQAGDLGSIGSRASSLRHSLDLKYIAENGNEPIGPVMSPTGNHVAATPPKLQTSFSSNDVPTVKSATGTAMMNNNANNHAQQHFHNHNASIGRIPAGAMPTRHARELSGDNTLGANRDQVNAYQSLQSALQANATPFGPVTAAPTAPASAAVTSPTSGSSMNSFNGYYPANGFPNSPAHSNGSGSNFSGVQLLTNGMQQLNMNGVGSNNAYPPQNFNGYGPMPFNQANQPRDSQARVIQHRRQLDNEAMSRYQNMPLESFRGQIYELCKDQHGCRYLQKKLEERNADQVHMIWLETNQHVIELMTDPFGNYLCQKLLEFCNDDERTVLIQNASQDMVRIALNQHGTRALQKMIEYVSTPQQVHLIIEALRYKVVELIKDLNGNHVIQKCLNKLTAIDAQFIFDAVGTNCIEVGTHRHGCCVLQRCIDHASGEQKLWLIQRITEHARILVQDPFGNYVVQYIIDLNEPTFTEPVVEMFRGCIGQLSRHKFSSNVIEKCLRCAQAPSKDMIVEEMLAAQELERLLRDSFANYVIQTALEYATPHQKYRLVEGIRPILPQIRTTPYGRRIQAKIAAYDQRGSAASSGQATPADNTQGQIPLRQGHSRGMSGSGSMLPSNGMTNGSAVAAAGSQPIRQNIQSYPNSSVITVPAAAGSGPTPQAQYAQALTPSFTPQHSTGTNSSGAGEAHWV
ncbi:putative RNA-binding protein [Stachybotrys elegans]|uniref:RNA-binding protein n=1 Tax=Stachybotrys elegans TaxID=80388 RepID=A0A8K0SZI6_9HYPO|nr:putative RNA-binding protein [Stachybotrys elegans]